MIFTVKKKGCTVLLCISDIVGECPPLHVSGMPRSTFGNQWHILQLTMYFEVRGFRNANYMKLLTMSHGNEAYIQPALNAFLVTNCMKDFLETLFH